jgi:hypothetical protein
LSSDPVNDGLGIDARHAFRWPLFAVGMLAGIAGAFDAIAFSSFGVFTANQAGNLVLVWVRLPIDAQVAAFSAVSMAGCALGIASVITARVRAVSRGRRTTIRRPLFAAIALLAVAYFLTSVVGVAPQRTDSTAEAAADWWQGAGLVAISAYGLGVLGASVLLVDGRRATVIGSTGAFMSAVRLTVVRIASGSVTWRDVWAVAVIPTSWSAGAAVAALVNPPPWGVVLGIVVVTALLVLSFRRVVPKT